MVVCTREGKCQTCKNWFELHPDGSGVCFGFVEPKDTDEDYSCERYNKGIPKTLLGDETGADLKRMLNFHKTNTELQETVDNFFWKKLN